MNIPNNTDCLFCPIKHEYIKIKDSLDLLSLKEVTILDETNEKVVSFNMFNKGIIGHISMNVPFGYNMNEDVDQTILFSLV